MTGNYMLKWTLCAIGVLTLSGCGIAEYFDQHSANVPGMTDDHSVVTAPASTVAPENAQAPAASAGSTAALTQGSVVQQTIGDDCNAVAASRAEDAAANGYDEDLQQTVHDKTYADCTAWNAAHR